MNDEDKRIVQVAIDFLGQILAGNIDTPVNAEVFRAALDNIDDLLTVIARQQAAIEASHDKIAELDKKGLQGKLRFT